MKTRWFPEQGDLVAVPSQGVMHPGLRGTPNYGLVLEEDESSDFKGVWWKIFHNGGIEVLHIHLIRPLWNLQGTNLQAER